MGSFRTKEKVNKINISTQQGKPICTLYALEGCYPHQIDWHQGIAKSPEATIRRLKRRKFLIKDTGDKRTVIPTFVFLEALEHWDNVIR